MFRSLPQVYEALPQEFRETAEQLFPPGGFSAGKGPTVEAASRFAEVLGVGSDYARVLMVDEPDRAIHRLLGHFQNNLDLLIQKTWVEKADELRKEKLQDRIPDFIAEIVRGDYRKALASFGAIIDELAYLFFGSQSHKEDFIEYVLRIDSQMGLFWWYGGRIASLSESSDDGWLRAVLLIGICYLSNV